MFLIGLTGGIASGKSVVGKRLAELGAVHVDADVLAREVVEPGSPALARIREEFGPAVLAADGSLDRSTLGALVFSDAANRSLLNSITHPAIWERARELFDAAAAANPDAIVVYDVPLLVESSRARPMRFDLIVVVHATVATRTRRLIELRDLSADEAAARLSSQATDTERLSIADVVIDSNGTLEETVEQVDELWGSLRERTRRRNVGGPA